MTLLVPLVVVSSLPIAGVPETNLRLIGVRTWGGSDNVVLSYATSLE